MHGVRAFLHRHRRRLIDIGPVAGLAVFSQLEVWTTELDLSPRWLLALVALATVLPVGWRRRWPVAATVGVLVGVVVLSLGWDVMDNFVSPFAALLVVIYSAAAMSDARRAAIAGGLVIVFIASGTALDGRPVGDMTWVCSIVAAVWLAGRGVHVRQQRAVALAERATLLEHERDAQARAAVAEERVRIARELHDVVAHGISVIVLQARGGRRVLHGEETEARAAFAEIETAAQEALIEMRRLLGMLRQSDEELALGPQPSLTNLGALATHIRDAGLPVDLHVEGDLGRLPAGVDLSAYRIVQEGLTNALKHAGPARARVFVGCRGDELEVEVVDDGLGVNGHGDSTGGHGLTGMRERVAMLGGSIEAGARDDGGFAVRARLPIADPGR